MAKLIWERAGLGAGTGAGQELLQPRIPAPALGGCSGVSAAPSEFLCCCWAGVLCPGGCCAQVGAALRWVLCPGRSCI